MKIRVDDVELTVTQTLQNKRVYVKIKRVVGRDRKRKRDITSGVETEMEDALQLLGLLKRVARQPTARCTCDYRSGFSDHAEHCQSIYAATDQGGYFDDD